jgi:hypothetical protein
MTIYGVSQTTGVERQLKVERGGEGVVLAIIDHAGGKEEMRVMVQQDDLLAAVTEPPEGGATVAGVSTPDGAKIQLDVEVRRNELQLRARASFGQWSDVAVGLDDFQDALEGVIARG